MRVSLGPPLRAAAIVAFVTGCALLVLNPPSLAGLGGLLSLLAGAVAIMLVTAWLTVAAIGKDEMPEPEFRRLVDRSEALAALPPPDQPPSEFDELVMEALDDLPEQFRELLERTPVVVSSRGHEHRAYGHYIGGTVARDIYPDRIVIYQDTLERDFGHDPDLLMAQVERTVRHELAHHLGWDEPGVRGLGL
jgi:predicted Zn-dependent protease with MMP-like domain